MLSAIVLEGPALKVFGLTASVPAFRVEGASFCGKEAIVEMENSIYRETMYRFAARAVANIETRLKHLNSARSEESAIASSDWHCVSAT